VFSILELLDTLKDDTYFQKKFNAKWEVDKINRTRNDKDLNLEELRQIADNLNAFFLEHRFIETFDITADGWNVARTLAHASNISALDAIHLATAYQAGCDIIVTHDQAFIKNARMLLKFDPRVKMRIAEPEKVELELKKLGFRKI
jgi:predicted nucleic acid-binding protein